MSEPEEELDWEEELSQAEGEMEKDDQRERARGAAEDRQEAPEDGEVVEQTERAERRARETVRRDLRVSIERAPGETLRTTWASENSRQALTRGMVGPQRTECRYCDFSSRSTKQLRVHIEQHFLRQYCPCGLNKASRDTMLEHAKRQNYRAPTGKSTE